MVTDWCNCTCQVSKSQFIMLMPTLLLCASCDSGGCVQKAASSLAEVRSWWIINWQCCKLVVKTDSDFLWLEMTNRWTSLSLLNCNNLFECSGILGCEITSLPNCLNARCKTQSYKNVEIAFSCFFVAFFSGLTLAWQFYMQAVQIYKVLYASRKIYNYYIGRELIVLSLTRPRTIIL